MVYSAYQDVPYFESDSYDGTSIYFNNSRLIVTSSGDMLGERNNFFTFFFVNADTVPQKVHFKMYQSAVRLVAGLVLGALSLSLFV